MPESKARRRVIASLLRGAATQLSGARGVHRDRKSVCDGYITFLALAEAADAELIVASDPHLTDMHPWREIPIIPPAAFLVGIR